MDWAVLVPGVLEYCAARLALHRCNLLEFWIVALPAHTINELVTVFLAEPLGFLFALLWPVLLCILP
jgi:hypothetical protein